MLVFSGSATSKSAVSILVVDDNDDHQQLIGHSLSRLVPGVNILIAATADETLAYLSQCALEYSALPVLLFLDLYLPDAETGWQLLQQIRTNYPQLAVVVISADQQPAMVLRAYQLGAHSFMSKPFHLEEWDKAFQSAADYWLQTVTLPRSRPSVF